MTDTTEYKPLPESFTKLGFRHELLDRIGLVAVYERWKDGQPHHFEVVRIRQAPAYSIAGNAFPACEVYPSPEQWGSMGFTFTEKQDAHAKMAAMLGGQP